MVLAEIYGDMGEHRRAIEVGLKAGPLLRQGIAECGPMDRGRAASLQRYRMQLYATLASAYEESGDHDRCREYHDKAMVVQEQTQSLPAHLISCLAREARSLRAHGRLADADGVLSIAEKWYREASTVAVDRMT